MFSEDERKKRIADSARRLIVEKKWKRLTVTDIVRECGITRQTFYYHFDGIPELVRWMIEREADQFIECVKKEKMPEEKLKQLILICVQVRPLAEKGMQTNYWMEIKPIFNRCFTRLVEANMEDFDIKKYCSPREYEFFLRYHCNAIGGVLKSWTEEDTEHMDEIVHQICRIFRYDILIQKNLSHKE